MKKLDLLTVVKAAKSDAVTYNSEFQRENEELLKSYLGMPYGDEVAERSQAISTDVADVVEADMPSLARIFLGSGDILTFEANGSDEQEEVEAREKTQYINWLVRRQPGSFKLIHDWIKDVEIQKTGVVKYFIEEVKKPREHEYQGVDESELDAILESLSGDNIEVEIVEQTEPDELGTFDIKFKTTRTEKKVRIINVPNESFLISKNATDKDSAHLVGDIVCKTRGQLLADGYKRDLVAKLQTAGAKKNPESNLPEIRFDDEGGEDYNGRPYAEWASEEVELSDLYVLVDYDNDGIAERRHILMSGDEILENEPFDHVPYAMMSAILMPHKAIGRSRAEITMGTQRIKSVLLRQTLDNVYMVNNGRNVVSSDVNLDDLLTVRPNGVVRMKQGSNRSPGDAVFPLQTPFVGDKSLTIMQYMDQARAQTTGSLMASQGLDADALNKETATRFNGVEDQGAAKVELVARVMAETGFRQLFEGLCRLVSHYQDTATEIRVLGKPMTIDPSAWKYEHYTVSSVGLGAGTNEKTVENKSAIYQIQQQLKQMQSPLVDDKKIYNTLADILQALDMPNITEHFNDPENPEELILAENEQLKGMVQQLMAQVEQLQNPLAEAETIKAQARLIEAQGDKEIAAMGETAQMQRFMMELEQKAAEREEKAMQFQEEMMRKITEMELKYSADVRGGLNEGPLR